VDVGDDAAMSWPYLITVSPALRSLSATLWPIGTSICAVRRKSELSCVTTHSISVPALRPSTTTTPDVSSGRARAVAGWSRWFLREGGRAVARLVLYKILYSRWWTYAQGLTYHQRPAREPFHGRVATLPAPVPAGLRLPGEADRRGRVGPGESLRRNRRLPAASTSARARAQGARRAGRRQPHRPAQGKGTYVAEHTQERAMFRFFRMARTRRGPRGPTSTGDVLKRRAARPVELAKLALSPVPRSIEVSACA